jgi:hypothetical protein
MGPSNKGLKEMPASLRSTIALRKTCHTSGSGQLGFIEPSISWDGPAFSVLLESANGIDAQPARVDAAVINNVPPRTQAEFLFSDIGTPISRLGVSQIYENQMRIIG